MSDPDAVLLYNSLRKVPNHFSMLAKSTELLNNTLNALENDIHMLVWVGTRMAGFLNACKQSSAILVPFLDKLIAEKVAAEEDAALFLSAKGLFTLELFSDLHSIFANQYLHCVDSDHVLNYEVYAVAHGTAEKLIHPTPKTDKIFNSLHLDQNNNVLVTLEDPLGSQVTHTINDKLTRHYKLQTIKNLLKTRNRVLNKLHDNIIDQNGGDSIFSILNVFDLTSESLEHNLKRISQLFCIFGENTTHDVEEECFRFKVKLTYKKITLLRARAFESI